MEGFRAAFPDSEVTVLDVVSGGEKVVLRWSFTGTHSAPILGIPASGIKTSWTGMTLYRIVDGLILEETGEEDFLSFCRQAGVA